MPTADITCPYCGEPNTISFEAEEDGDAFVQDCSVCCRPWQVKVQVRRDGSFDVAVRPEGE